MITVKSCSNCTVRLNSCSNCTVKLNSCYNCIDNIVILLGFTIITKRQYTMSSFSDLQLSRQDNIQCHRSRIYNYHDKTIINVIIITTMQYPMLSFSDFLINPYFFKINSQLSYQPSFFKINSQLFYQPPFLKINSQLSYYPTPHSGQIPIHLNVCHRSRIYNCHIIIRWTL